MFDYILGAIVAVTMGLFLVVPKTEGAVTSPGIPRAYLNAPNGVPQYDANRDLSVPGYLQSGTYDAETSTNLNPTGSSYATASLIVSSVTWSLVGCTTGTGWSLPTSAPVGSVVEIESLVVSGSAGTCTVYAPNGYSIFANATSGGGSGSSNTITQVSSGVLVARYRLLNGSTWFRIL